MLLYDLIKDARQGNYDLVDRNADNLGQGRAMVSWALEEGLKEITPGARYLAARAIESAIEAGTLSAKRLSQVKPLLEKMVENDKNRVKYAAAFALAANSPKEVSEPVEKAIRRALNDKSLGDTAGKYFEKMNK